MVNLTGSIASALAAQAQQVRRRFESSNSRIPNSFGQQMAAANVTGAQRDSLRGASPGRQDFVTRRDSVASATTGAAATAAAGAPPPAATFMPLTKAVDVRPPDLGVAANPHGLDAATGKPRETEADAYWDAQPAAVQALRDVNDPDRRAVMAKQLADQGYTIDVPIMVWNWDPQTTMTVRQNMGYTWVPSGNQVAVQVAPGLSFPGLPSYDATKAPAGSINVSTAFANGATGQNPWIKS